MGFRNATRRRLVLVKLLHTVVWGFFAGCIVALPLVALAGRLRLAAWLAVTVLIEGHGRRKARTGEGRGP